MAGNIRRVHFAKKPIQEKTGKDMTTADFQDNPIALLKRTLGWSQNQIAEYFNRTPGTISAYNTGKSQIPTHMLKAIEILLHKKKAR